MNNAEAMLVYGKILLERNETPEIIEEGAELIRKSAWLVFGKGI